MSAIHPLRLHVLRQFLILLPVLAILGCPPRDLSRSDLSRPSPPEHSITQISLCGPLADGDAEISAMAWYAAPDGDSILVLVPQKAGTFRGGGVYGLRKREIDAYLEQRIRRPLEPAPIRFVLPEDLKEHEFEAIAFSGSDVYMTIEVERGEIAHGLVVVGTMSGDGSELRLSGVVSGPVASRSGKENMAEEAMIVMGDTIFTIHELNGAHVGGVAPHVHLLRRRGEGGIDSIGRIPIAPLEYRITDATPPDERGRFWVLNYFSNLSFERYQAPPDGDQLAARFGRGATHARFGYVERLVELELRSDSIVLSGRPPVQLALLDSLGDRCCGRNWEALVRLDARGFLLATDKFPQTILAFVPYRLPQFEAEW